MKLNTVLTINAVATLLFGLAFLIAPETSIAMYGSTTDVTGQFMVRYAGSLLLGITIWTWSGRRVADPIFRRAMIFAHSVPWLIILVLATWWTLSGLTDSRGWGNVILALLFLIAYGYCLVKPALQALSPEETQQ